MLIYMFRMAYQIAVRLESTLLDGSEINFSTKLIK